MRRTEVSPAAPGFPLPVTPGVGAPFVFLPSREAPLRAALERGVLLGLPWRGPPARGSRPRRKIDRSRGRRRARAPRPVLAGPAMLLLHEPVPLELAVAGWVALLPALALALLAVRHRFLPESWAQHAWLAGIATIAVLWTMSVKTGAGVQLGMLGAGLYSVIFGRARAFLGLAAAVVLHTALTGGPAASLGLNGLLFAALPAWVGGSLQRVLERRLPHNLFVFIIGNGMFVSLVANAITGIAALLVSVGAQVPAAADNLGEYLAYTLMLAWGEALLSGMLFSALVVFRPVAVPTYSQDVYLPRRRR